MNNSVDCDAFDRKLLHALARDSSLSTEQLSEQVGLSASQCYRRRLRLEKSGAIRGYRAVVDPKMLGFTVTAFVQLSMSHQSTHQHQEFLTFLARRPGVQSCHAVTGDADYILRVRAADLDGLNDFVKGLLAHGKSRLHVRSLVVLETIMDG